ncbi:MAG: serine/threonine protein kinase, partial [Myxococcales bacterium]
MRAGFADIPEQLGRYEIVQRLSAGGMGEVFVARVAGPGGFLKPVAVKRIHPHLSSDEAFIHMLHDEANVTAAIKHPNVVQIIEVGHENDSHFVVLDYVSGETLSKIRRDLLRGKQQMPIWLVAWIGAEVAGALHAAHEARSLEGEPLDIIHRDVSLGNIMLSDDGRPMLFDFGVAKAKQRLTHTMAGELKGKIAYMAPEVFHGATVDRSIDLYALGIVLYELLTGRSPFQGDSDIETLAAIQSGEAVLISDVRPDIDWLLAAIVMRAMNHSREERYQSGAQLEQALREWARKNGQPHDNSAAAQWASAAFPERLQERRALLARVATRQRSNQPLSSTGMFTPVSTAGTNLTFGRSGGVYDPAA